MAGSVVVDKTSRFEHGYSRLAVQKDLGMLKLLLNCSVVFSDARSAISLLEIFNYWESKLLCSSNFFQDVE